MQSPPSKDPNFENNKNKISHKAQAFGKIYTQTRSPDLRITLLTTPSQPLLVALCGVRTRLRLLGSPGFSPAFPSI